jgi:flavorubredoxin
MGVLQPVPVTESVYWVGAVDWSVRDFHGYATRRGTTYNAYLILADRITLVDTVKAGFRQEMLERIAGVVDPAKIDVVVSNHSEPDHTGELGATIHIVRPQAVYASVNGKKALEAHYRLGATITAVTDGQSVDLGGASLVFAETKMCHWPDSMVAYLPGEKILFSQDAFGMHLASFERFADQLDPALLEYEAAKYFANILLPLSDSVTRNIEKLKALNLPIAAIAPDHGPVWRTQPERIVDRYAAWARQERGNKAVVLYDTMWKSTEAMAQAVAEGLGAGGARPTLMPVAGVHRSDVATRLLDSGALLVGSPTLNNELLPGLADVLTYVKGLRPKGLVGGVFGSYGWSGEATDKAAAFLKEMGVEVVGDPLRARYVADAEVRGRAFDLGRAVAEKLSKG